MIDFTITFSGMMAGYEFGWTEKTPERFISVRLRGQLLIGDEAPKPLLDYVACDQHESGFARQG